MVIILLSYIIVGLFQFPILIRNKNRRELIAFSSFYIVALILSIMYALNINIPSLMRGLQYIYEKF